jgi:hypothetical protein
MLAAYWSEAMGLNAASEKVCVCYLNLRMKMGTTIHRWCIFDGLLETSSVVGVPLSY